MYDTRKRDDRQKANILIRLCMIMLRCLIKYNESNNSTLQVPFSMALSFGRYNVNEGVTSGTGKIFLLRITTTANTNMDTAATKRNINLSVIFIRIGIKNSFST
jgi:hypothetical protein